MQALRRKARPAGDSGAVFSVGSSASAGAPEAAGEAAPAGPTGSVGALLSIQEVDTGSDKRRQALNRADEMLDLLDELQHGLLMGSVSPGRLRQLLTLANAKTVEFTDPRLAGILAEIEVRAKVELAKLEAASRAD